MADTLKHSMDENSRELYTPPTLTKFLGEAPEGPNCKKYGRIISDFVKRETHTLCEVWNEEYITSIWSLPTLERLQKLQIFIADFKEFVYDKLIAAFIGHYNEKGLPSRDLVYSFIDEHWGGDMDCDIINLVKYAVANYVEPELPNELTRTARRYALKDLMDYMEEIHSRVQLEGIEIKRLIRYGY